MAALLHVSFSVRPDAASAPRFAAFQTERSHVLSIARGFRCTSSKSPNRLRLTGITCNHLVSRFKRRDHDHHDECIGT
ncbi:MAG TPA: hypothetical protein VKA62_06975, partial [Agromyces sp.]|nr:hypothetical protein [Agromyces sp.]